MNKRINKALIKVISDLSQISDAEFKEKMDKAAKSELYQSLDELSQAGFTIKTKKNKSKKFDI